ncbi:hypothetical protein [Afifella sp. YEN Y35]|uniref:hypothetical protein n=1 Tax=Afifella sp. YEN Y35 TaxID=3388337 RepID=UPI0039E19E96
MTNYNHLHKPRGRMVTSSDGGLTVGDIRDAIAGFPDDTEVILSPCSECAAKPSLSGFDQKGPKEILFNTASREIDD